jgi:hypothetical protein
MACRTLTHFAAAAGLAAVLSLAAVTPSSARWAGRHYVGSGVAIGAGAAALAFGAAAAAAAASSAYGDSGGNDSSEGYYDHQSGVVLVGPGPVYGHSSYGVGPNETYGWQHPGECGLTIHGC